jgi:hypothetical protein
MKVDKQGNNYAAGPSGVWVLTPVGKHLGTIRPPEKPAHGRKACRADSGKAARREPHQGRLAHRQSRAASSPYIDPRIVPFRKNGKDNVNARNYRVAGFITCAYALNRQSFSGGKM